MALKVKRFHLSCEQILWFTLQLNIPRPHLWKLVLMFGLMIIIPQAFSQQIFDIQVSRCLFEIFVTFFSLLRPRIFRRRFLTLVTTLCQRERLIALAFFGVKAYIVYRGLKVTPIPERFNKPVIFRSASISNHSKCQSLSPTEERDFLIWEIETCSKTWLNDEEVITSYVPSVQSDEGSERRCLSAARGRHIGAGQIYRHQGSDSGPAYEHNVTLIKSLCRTAGVNCDFLQSSSSQNGVTWIVLGSPYQRIVLSFAGKHRPAPTVIREVALAVRAGANRKKYVGTALAVAQAVRHSVCFVRDSVVDTVKVPHLEIDLLPLLLLYCMEALFRMAFRKDDDPTEERSYDDYLNVALEELCK